MNIKNMNTTALAYMGDAVYEQAVRKHILEGGLGDVNKLHRLATRYVSAPAQATIIKSLFDDLTEEEQKLVKRARNRKYHTKAKNADPVTYKWATALEALIGYLYLSEEEQRLEWVMKRAIEIIEKGTANG
ncbi:MAG: ribonuclease III domain-containing protein [Bacillota bacterium]|nr:ribonuclease III domain-containing protein [Bacillota bacterium]